MNENPIYPKLDQCLKEYRRHLNTVKNLSQNSVNAYLSDLSVFKRFHRQYPGNWLSREYLSSFLKHLFSMKYVNSTISRYRCSLSHFFDYLVSQKTITSSPAKLLGRYKRLKTSPQIWSQKQVHQILAKLKPKEQVNHAANYRKERDYIITEILYCLGLRIAELTCLKVNDIDLTEGVVLIKGKGGHHQILPLTPHLVKVIGKYLNIRLKFFDQIRKPDHGVLLANHQGDPITIRGVRFVFQHRLLLQGEKVTHPHVLRHSLASHLLENGAGIRQVQKVLRHQTISSTQVYTQLNPQLVKKQYWQSHPLAKKETDDPNQS